MLLFYVVQTSLPAKKRGKWLAASTTALYPEMFAIELSASNTWALDILGMQSMAEM